MDDGRFAAWTRRRFGRVIGGLLATLAGLGAGPLALARSRQQGKTCRPHHVRCGKHCVKGTCCPGKACGSGCFCTKTVEGVADCFRAVPFACHTNCQTSADCGKDGRCIAAACQDPPATVCLPLCAPRAG